MNKFLAAFNHVYVILKNLTIFNILLQFSIEQVTANISIFGSGETAQLVKCLIQQIRRMKVRRRTGKVNERLGEEKTWGESKRPQRIIFGDVVAGISEDLTELLYLVNLSLIRDLISK